MRGTFNQSNRFVGKPRVVTQPGDRETKDIRATDKALKLVEARLASNETDIAGWLRSSELVGASGTTKSCIMLKLTRRVSRDELVACREALCL